MKFFSVFLWLLLLASVSSATLGETGEKQELDSYAVTEAGTKDNFLAELTTESTADLSSTSSEPSNSIEEPSSSTYKKLLVLCFVMFAFIIGILSAILKC
jgi:hypothetical protein